MSRNRTIALIAMILSLLLVGFAAPGSNDRLTTIDGVAATGPNRRLGTPIWNLGPPFGAAGFTFVYGHNPNGGAPLALNPSSPADTLLATGIDPNFAAAFGIDPAAFADLVNVPFRQVAIITGPGSTRAQVPPHGAPDLPPFAASRSLPNNPITLGQWLEAGGRARIRCFGDHTTIAISLRNVIPNGVYTVWGIFDVPNPNPNGPPRTLLPTALGGVPNVVVADGHGRASFTRELGFCPLTEQALKFIDISYHSDGATYGGTPSASFPGGTVSHTHVAFPVNVAGPAE
jgi:hypothetical protein